MIAVSAGSAACLGLTANRMDVYPTTAYFLSGSSCRMGCSFCPRSGGKQEAVSRLGRVTWPEYSWEQVEKALSRAGERGVKRVCIQSVRHADGIDSLLGLVERFRKVTELPLSMSAWIESEEEAAELFKAGVDRVSISIDVASPEAYRTIKGGSFQERCELLISSAGRFPGKMSTHLICGLGESEQELLSLAARLIAEGVTAGLFAFVPLKGTPLETGSPPPLEAYRRVQAALFLLKNRLVLLDSLQFKRGRLVSFGLPAAELKRYLAGGRAFQTSGCPDCNRPYYNERPGGDIYNYHRRLNAREIENAVDIVLFPR